MVTIAQAIRAFLESAGGKVTGDQIKHHISAQYPGQWKTSTVQAQLYACVVNNPKAYIHHPYAERFLYRDADGTFGLYAEPTHGPNVWAPPDTEEQISELGELAETSISLERDIEEHLAQHLSEIEGGLRVIGRQVTTDVGRIDILAEDAKGFRVIIEVKVGEARDAAIGQIARYLGWYAKKEGKPLRGMLIAGDFREDVRYAAAAIPTLRLIVYRVHFSFEKVDL